MKECNENRDEEEFFISVNLVSVNVCVGGVFGNLGKRSKSRKIFVQYYPYL